MDEDSPKPLYTDPNYKSFPKTASEELFQMQSETDFKGANDFMKSNERTFSQQTTFVDLNLAEETAATAKTDEVASFAGEAKRNEPQFYQQQPVPVHMSLQPDKSIQMGNTLGLMNAIPRDSFPESTILQQTQLQSQLTHQKHQLAQQQQQIELQQKQLSHQQQCLQNQIKQPLFMHIEPNRSPNIQTVETNLDAMLGQNIVKEEPSISPHDSIHNPFIDKSPVISPQVGLNEQNQPTILPNLQNQAKEIQSYHSTLQIAQSMLTQKIIENDHQRHNIETLQDSNAVKTKEIVDLNNKLRDTETQLAQVHAFVAKTVGVDLTNALPTQVKDQKETNSNPNGDFVPQYPIRQLPTDFIQFPMQNANLSHTGDFISQQYPIPMNQFNDQGSNTNTGNFQPKFPMAQSIPAQNIQMTAGTPGIQNIQMTTLNSANVSNRGNIQNMQIPTMNNTTSSAVGNNPSIQVSSNVSSASGIQNLQIPIISSSTSSFPTMNQAVQRSTNQSFSKDVQSNPNISNTISQQFSVIAQPNQFSELAPNPNTSNPSDFQSFSCNQIMGTNFGPNNVSNNSDFQQFSGIGQNIQMPTMNSTSVADFQNIRIPTINSNKNTSSTNGVHISAMGKPNSASINDLQNMKMPAMANANITNAADFQMPTINNSNTAKTAADFQNIPISVMGNVNPNSAVDLKNISTTSRSNSNATNDAADYQNIHVQAITNSNSKNATDFQNIMSNSNITAVEDFQNIQFSTLSKSNSASVADSHNAQMPARPAAHDAADFQMPTINISNVTNIVGQTAAMGNAKNVAEFQTIKMPAIDNPNPSNTEFQSVIGNSSSISSADMQNIQIVKISNSKGTNSADFQKGQISAMGNTSTSEFHSIQMPKMNSNGSDFELFTNINHNSHFSAGCEFIPQSFPALSQIPQNFTSEQLPGNSIYNLNPMPMNMVLLDPSQYLNQRISASTHDDDIEKETSYAPSIFSRSQSAVALSSEQSYTNTHLSSIPVARSVSESVLNRPSEVLIPWMPKDDEELMELVEKLNKDWNLIANKLENRTPEQCHNRFQLIQQIRKNWEEQQRSRIINDDNVTQPWTPEEDGELVELFRLFPNDWKTISNKFNNRSADQCQNRFYFVQRVLHNFEEQKRIKALNQSIVVDCQWTPKDDVVLTESFQQYPNEWNIIASKLEKKTPEQCYTRFQLIHTLIRANGWEEKQSVENLQPRANVNIPIPLDIQSTVSAAEEAEISEVSRRRTHSQSVDSEAHNNFEKRQRTDASEWLPEDNNLLSQYAETFDKDWVKISSKFEGKTAEQCMSQWHLIQPRHGKWLAEEDEQLLLTYQNLIEKETLENGVPPNTTQTIFWCKVAGYIFGRSGKQCMARYTETLDPRVIKGKWSAEEDMLLTTGMEKYGKSWVKLSGNIPGRTQRQCRTRWIQLTKDQSAKDSKGKDMVEASDDDSAEDEEE